LVVLLTRQERIRKPPSQAAGVRASLLFVVTRDRDMLAAREQFLVATNNREGARRSGALGASSVATFKRNGHRAPSQGPDPAGYRLGVLDSAVIDRSPSEQ
jgi:hypothetical protein